MKKELWFGLSIMAMIVLATAILMPAPSQMTNGHLGLLMLSLVVVAIMLGFPTAFTLMGMGMVFTWFAYGGDVPKTLTLMVERTFAVMTNEVLLSIPLFVFMGYLVERANLIEKLFKSLHLAMARVPGSLAVATLVTCAIFATATGIVGAVVTLMGLLALPAMMKAGYNTKLSAGAITAGGCLGILIPPSVMLIVYGATAGVSVVQLYAGAFFPGIMLASLYIIYVIIVAKLKPHWAPPLPESERQVPLPAETRAIAASGRTNALSGIVAALKGRVNAGVPTGALLKQGLIIFLPVIAFAGLMGTTWHLATAPAESTGTEGLQEMGTEEASTATERSADKADGVQEPPKDDGVQEPPKEAGGVQEPPKDGGVSEPPKEAVASAGNAAKTVDGKASSVDAKKDAKAAAGNAAASSVANKAPSSSAASNAKSASPAAASAERLPTPTWFTIMVAAGAVLLAGFYMIFTFTRLEVFKMLLGSFFPLAMLILAVLGTIVFGLATPTEAAAVGSLGGLLLAAAYKQLNMRVVQESVFLTAKTTAMVCWLFVGSSIFSAAFALLGGQELIEKWVLSLGLTKVQFLILSQFIIFILGWPLEWTEIIVIFMPIFIPLLVHFDVDPLFFGLLVALNLQTAFLSPPVAMAAFYLKGVAPPSVTLNQIFAGMIPFMVIQVIALALLYIFPQIGMWLPEVLYK